MLSESFKWALLQMQQAASRDILTSFSSFLQFRGELSGGREGGSLHASSGEGSTFLSVCMVEIHCKKSKYLQGIYCMQCGWESERDIIKLERIVFCLNKRGDRQVGGSPM